MINERILVEEFWKLFDLVHNRLNWPMSLVTFEIENETLAKELDCNESLESIIEDLLQTKQALSFLMIGYRAQENPSRCKEVLMHYAGRLGYAMHQLNITDISSYDGDVIYDDYFTEYQVDNYIQLMADFLCDDYLSEKFSTNKLHHESFIYFSMIMGYVMRSQIIKLEMNEDKNKSKVKHKSPVSQSILILPFPPYIHIDYE